MQICSPYQTTVHLSFSVEERFWPLLLKAQLHIRPLFLKAQLHIWPDIRSFRSPNFQLAGYRMQKLARLCDQISSQPNIWCIPTIDEKKKLSTFSFCNKKLTKTNHFVSYSLLSLNFYVKKWRYINGVSFFLQSLCLKRCFSRDQLFCQKCKR